MANGPERAHLAVVAPHDRAIGSETGGDALLISVRAGVDKPVVTSEYEAAVGAEGYRPYGSPDDKRGPEPAWHGNMDVSRAVDILDRLVPGPSPLGGPRW